MTDKEAIVGECAAADPETKQETTGAPVSSTITTGDPHSSPHTVNHDDVPPSPGSSPHHHHRHRSHSHRHRHNSRERLSTDPSDDVKDEDKDRDRHRSRSRHGRKYAFPCRQTCPPAADRGACEGRSLTYIANSRHTFYKLRFR